MIRDYKKGFVKMGHRPGIYSSSHLHKYKKLNLYLSDYSEAIKDKENTDRQTDTNQ